MPDESPSENALLAAEAVMEESRRLLVRQEADLDTLRGKVSMILVGSSIVAALFGSVSVANQSGEASWARVAAYVMFAFSVLASLIILWPRTWRFDHDLGEWLNEIKDGEYPDRQTIAYNLAENFASFRNQNAPAMKCLYSWFAAACLFLGLQVVAWGVASAF